jgi:hypothetical protein
VGLRRPRPFCQRCQLIQNGNIFFGESSRLGRRHLKDSVDSTPALNRQHGDRSQAESPANLKVNQRIIFCVRAILNFSGAQAFAGNSGISTQLRSNRGSSFAAARTADHRAVSPHRERGSARPGQSASSIRESREHRIQSMLASCD